MKKNVIWDIKKVVQRRNLRIRNQFSTTCFRAGSQDNAHVTRCKEKFGKTRGHIQVEVMYVADGTRQIETEKTRT